MSSLIINGDIIAERTRTSSLPTIAAMNILCGKFATDYRRFTIQKLRCGIDEAIEKLKRILNISNSELV